MQSSEENIEVGEEDVFDLEGGDQAELLGGLERAGRGGMATVAALTLSAATAVYQQATMERVRAGMVFLAKSVASWAIKRALDRLMDGPGQ